MKLNILIVKLSAIGDVVLTLPFLSVLRRAHPEAHITWVVEEAAADILAGHPHLDKVLVSKRRTWLAQMKKGRLRTFMVEFKSFLKELRSRQYDMVIDFQGLLKSSIMTFLSGGKRRIGFDRTRELSYLVYNEKIPRYDPDQHALLRNLGVAKWLGISFEQNQNHALPENLKAAAEAEKLLGGFDQQFIAINPAARWLTKLWPRQSWAGLIDRLIKELNIRIVLTGGSDDVALNREIGQGRDNVLDITGRCGLRILSEIFRHASVVICPDTGPMHLAACVEAPVVALFGPTAPWRSGPFGDGNIVVRNELDCSPCMNKTCDDPKCMTGLKVDDVFEAVSKQLSG